MFHSTSRTAAFIGALLAVACCATFASSARAQQPPTWMLVQGRYVAQQEALGSAGTVAPPALTTTSGEETGSPAPMYGHSAGQNRARNLIAAGAGFMIAAGVTTAIAMTHREPCYGSDVPKGKLPTVAAAGVGALGLAAVVGATTWYVRDRRQHNYRVTTRQRLIAGGMGALSFVLVQAMLGSLIFADQLC